MRWLLLLAFTVLGSARVGSGQEHVSPIDTRVATKAEVNHTSPMTANLPPAGPATSDYVLGPGDHISIIVLELEDDFSEKTFRIDMSGDVSLPYVGRLHAAGLTTQAPEKEIATTLSKIIKEPDVTIGIAEFASQPVSVLGEVNQAGQYQVQGAKKLLEALSMAQGFTEFGGNTITITRDLKWGPIPLPNAHDDASGQFSIASLNVKGLLKPSDPSQNIPLMPDDIVAVSRSEVVYAVGSVNLPGGFELGQNE